MRVDRRWARALPVVALALTLSIGAIKVPWPGDGVAASCIVCRSQPDAISLFLPMLQKQRRSDQGPVETTTPTSTPTWPLHPTSTVTPTWTATTTPTEPIPTPTTTKVPDWIITGAVAFQGLPIEGIAVKLGMYGALPEPQTLMTATTSLEGIYRFEIDQAILPEDSSARVIFENEVRDIYLASWRARPIVVRVGQGQYAGGDFDIADARLLAPDSETPQPFPIAFRWEARDPTWAPGETYQVEINDAKGNAFFSEDNLESGEFVLAGRPSNLGSGQIHTWRVWIWNEHGYGRSFHRHSVAFVP